MKNIDWTTYGIETEHSASAYQGEAKQFKVENDHIYFNTHKKFAMGVMNFVACCYNAQSVPITPEEDTDEVYIGEDDGYQVYMNRTIQHDIGNQEQVGIIVRNHGKWYSWIRFTMSELVSILEEITKQTDPEEISQAKQIKPAIKPKATKEDVLKAVQKQLANLQDVLDKLMKIKD